MAPSRACLTRMAYANAFKLASECTRPRIRFSSRLACPPLLRNDHPVGACPTSCLRSWYRCSLPLRYSRAYSQQPSSVAGSEGGVGSGVEPPEYLNDAELQIFRKIQQHLEPVKLEVQDISGGCGSMYALEIESPRFKGLNIIKQHKLVNEVLREEISGWHGVRLKTRAP